MTSITYSTLRSLTSVLTAFVLVFAPVSAAFAQEALPSEPVSDAPTVIDASADTDILDVEAADPAPIADETAQEEPEAELDETDTGSPEEAVDENQVSLTSSPADASAELAAETTVSPGTGLQAAIDAAAPGDTLKLQAGTYVVSGELNISKPITIVGEGSAETFVDTQTSTGYGVNWTGDDVTLSRLTVLGPKTGSAAFGLKIQSAVSGTSVKNVTLTDMVVRGSNRTEIDLNFVDGASLNNVSAEGQTTPGVGIAVTASQNVTITNTTTKDNNWGGIALYSANSPSAGAPVTNNVTITNSTLSEPTKLLKQEKRGEVISNISVPQFGFLSKNPNFRASEGFFTIYHLNETDAVNSAVTLQAGTVPDTSVVQTVGADGMGQNTFIVGTGMSIQAAVDAAAAGGTVNVRTGTYMENVTIGKALTLNGARSGTDARSRAAGNESTVTGSGSTPIIQIGSGNVTVDGFTVTNGTSGITSNASNVNTLIRNNIITGNSIGVYAEAGAGSIIERNLFDANNVPGSAGGAAIYTERSSGLTIRDNEFENHAINSAVIFAATAPSAHTGLVFSVNNIHDNNPNNTMVYVVGVNGGTFSGNTISQPGSTAIKFASANSDITVSGNLFAGSATGVKVIDGTTEGINLGINSGITITRNNLAGVTMSAIANLGGYVGSLIGIENWWGDASGPATSANPLSTGETFEGDVTFDPWCTNVECAAFSNDTIADEDDDDDSSNRGRSGGRRGGGGGSDDDDTGGQVLGAATTTIPVMPSTGGQVLGASTYSFMVNLTVGSTGADVTELQTRLIAGGYLMIAAPTGYFGELTRAAVAKWQMANGIMPTAGYFGPLSRVKMNAGTAPSNIQAQIDALMAQIAAIRVQMAASTTSN